MIYFIIKQIFSINYKAVSRAVFSDLAPLGYNYLSTSSRDGLGSKFGPGNYKHRDSFIMTNLYRLTKMHSNLL